MVVLIPLMGANLQERTSALKLLVFLTSQADNIPDGQRASAFGILSGVFSAAFVCGTLVARFLSTASTFQVAAIMSILAVAYTRVFLKESRPNADGIRQPILKGAPDATEYDGDIKKTPQVFKRIPSLGDLIYLMKSSVTFSQAAVVTFFNSLPEGGMMGSLLAISQLFFMPMLAPAIGEEKLLCIGLLMGCINVCALSALLFIFSMQPFECAPTVGLFIKHLELTLT
ncbi:hypothetical protein CJ030_MR4G018387 [Morella rubra]|uniref:Major facilitator superfamily (MFS) profile domain-containing protein n=1 Tax=Morella rubra TaxID=262757 RepID=A0A6A1VQU9_9ROSI|nr:hypothetical protein CJ030_MR4G018387 [Morella rubra]